MALTLKPKLAPAAGDEATAYDAALALTGASVAGYWRPTKDNYLGRITRDQLLAIGREVLGEAWSQSRSSEKKALLVDQLDRAFADPEKFGRTPDQVEKLKTWLPTGMSFDMAETETGQGEEKQEGRLMINRAGRCGAPPIFESDSPMTDTIRFPLGQVAVTARTPACGSTEVLAALRRHNSGDWEPNLCRRDTLANDSAVQDGDRLLSAYGEGDHRFWIITESDRSVTTILLPEDY